MFLYTILNELMKYLGGGRRKLCPLLLYVSMSLSRYTYNNYMYYVMSSISAKNGDTMKVLDVVFTEQMTFINATYSLSKLY